MKGETIGELEELILLIVGGLGHEAYAVNILDELHEKAKRRIDVTAIHAVLRRLERKGYVSSEMRGATHERGGRRKRYFTLNKSGREALDHSMTIRTHLYRQLPELGFKT